MWAAKLNKTDNYYTLFNRLPYRESLSHNQFYKGVGMEERIFTSSHGYISLDPKYNTNLDTVVAFREKRSRYKNLMSFNDPIEVELVPDSSDPMFYVQGFLDINGDLNVYMSRNTVKLLAPDGTETIEVSRNSMRIRPQEIIGFQEKAKTGPIGVSLRIVITLK